MIKKSLQNITNNIYKVTKQAQKDGLISAAIYNRMYKQSIEDNEGFWREHGKRIHWFKPYTQVSNVSYNPENVNVEWFKDGITNVSYNCIDRHVAQGRGSQTAIIWEGDNPADNKKITYRELLDEVSRLANALKMLGVKKGDKVTIYLPMIPEIAYSMLACARIGAIHSVVFGGFSPDAIANRIEDCESDFVITADQGVRGGRQIPLKANVDEALKICKRKVKQVLVVERTYNDIQWNDIDLKYNDIVPKQSNVCEPEWMDAEDPLFILYTSGSTGKPKGVVHSSGGYLVYASMTHQYIFNYKPGDVYWCTADCGWITGHSYIVYGPLANAATTIIFEGIPTYPNISRFWNVIDKHQVNIFYTAPTAIRSLMRAGEEPVTNTSRQSLKLLATVGEPINPEAWEWYYRVVGNKKCPIVDTWWQTETGGIMISAQSGAHDLKPGSAVKPFFGIKPELVDQKNNEVEGVGEGALCFSQSWPGQMRTVYKDHDRFQKTYFQGYEGRYFSGDGCYRDEDDYHWITGRMDDVIITSGHNLGTAEIESAFVSHDLVSEAAVVGFPHDIKGQGIYCYVTLLEGVDYSNDLKLELVKLVRKTVGPVATPDFIQFTHGLPKTRSGKIMRRILRKIAAHEFDELGDTTTLADPSIVDQLVNDRKILDCE